MKRIYPVLLCTIIFLSSCSISDELRYKGYDNFHVNGSLQQPEVGVDVTLYNPNPIGVKIKNMDLVIRVNDTAIGTVCLEKPVKLKAHQEFTLPIMMQTSLAQIGTLTAPGLQSLFFDKPLALEISGNITLRKFIFKRSFDFNYEDKLRLGDIKMN